MKKLILIKNEKLDSNVVEIQEDDIDMEFFEKMNNEKLREATGLQIEKRSFGPFRDKSLQLEPNYDYILGKDENNTILVPLKKKNYVPLKKKNYV